MTRLRAVRRLFEQVFAWGQRCERQGRVRSLFRNEDIAAASGPGSSARPYSQRIALQPGSDGVLRGIDGRCYCPLGRGGAVPALRLAFDYGGRLVRAFPYDDSTFRDNDVVVTLKRNHAAEERLHRRLDDCGADEIELLDYLSFQQGAEPLDHVSADGA